MYRVALFGLLGIACAGSAPARTPVSLAPSSKWNLHYAENSCQLIRTFGDGNRPLSLVLERLTPDSRLSLLVFGKALRARVGEGRAAVAFQPFPSGENTTSTIAETDQQQTALLWSGVSIMGEPETKIERNAGERPVRDLAQETERRSQEAASAAKVTGLEIVEPSGRRIRLATGPLDRALALMRDCGREKLVEAGIDPDVKDRIVKPAFNIVPLDRLIKSDDYPAGALFDGAEGVVSARLHIGADGAVTNCTSLTRYKTPGFAEVVCNNLRKARFLPAELADGTKVADVTVATIIFRME